MRPTSVTSLAGVHFARRFRRLACAATLLLLMAALMTRSQAPLAANRSDAAKAAALALDKQIIAQVKDGPEVMANLTYLSDQIGARLTGSDALKRANEWAAQKMESYGLTNVHL